MNIRLSVPSGCKLKPAIAALAAAMGLVALGGCGTDRIVRPSVTPDDYHARHPIVLADARTSLDVFPATGQGRLDRHTAKQIFAFAAQYRELGRGPVLVLMPRIGRRGDPRSLIADIRASLAAGGAHGGVEVSTYPVADPGLASPVRLSFVGVKAKVASQCGQWPSDLGPGTNVDGWDNKTYWNFGCATQQMIAAQTSDPRDLVTPRGEEPSDTLVRARGIESIRKGTDPATKWIVQNTNIGAVGGTTQ